MESRWRIALAEAIGTAVLVVGGCGTAVFAAGNSSGVGAVGVATAFGLSLLITAYAIGPVSGCHINPAVTLGLAVARKVDSALVPVYIAAQVVGGLLGGLFIRAVLKTSDGAFGTGYNMASNGYGSHSPNGFGLTAVAIVEVALTALLVFVVLSTTRPGFATGFGGLAVGATLWLIHLISIPIDNTSVNPARSLAVAPFAVDSWPMRQLWVFLVFPLLGGIVAAIVWMVLDSGSEPRPDFPVEEEDVVFDESPEPADSSTTASD